MCDLAFANQLTEECLKHYNSLPKKCITENEWTYLSAVVMSLEEKITVVAMATGTKCLGRNQMSPNGDVVNDSHSEVLARRSFLRYIYEQIKEFKVTGKSNTITKLDEKNQYEINPRIRFHFYTSHVPCGDASIVPKFGSNKKRKSTNINNGIKSMKKKRINEKMQPIEDLKKIDKDTKGDTSESDCEDNLVGELVDIHRTGAKCVVGEDRKTPGALYHSLGVVRTKPGRGDPTLSVSCSDKLTRWIACGIQGALLSLLLNKPVLLDSVVVGGGGPYCPLAMHRALISRLHSTHCPRLLHSLPVFPHSQYQRNSSAKPCPAAILWARISYKPVEVCVEGRRQGSTKSSGAKGRLMVCKHELLRNFLSVADEKYKGMTYRGIKALAHQYYRTWSEVQAALGAWTTKPAELEHFTLSD